MQGLVDDSDRSTKYQNATLNADSNDTQKVSDGNKDSIRNWTRGHSCYIMSKILPTIYQHIETSLNNDFNGDRIINPAEKFQGSP